MVNKPLARWTGLVVLMLWLGPQVALAAASEAGTMVIVADSRSQAGWLAGLSNLYNESLLYFTLLTVVVIPAVGAILGKLTDLLMSRLGVDLKSRVLAER
jgi:hypothetical protein